MSRIRHADLYGPREGKYAALERLDVATTEWTEIEPQTPWYLFKPFDLSLWGEYGEWWKVNEVFPVNSVGIVTARDRLTIHFTRDELWQTVTDFVALEPEQARRKYQLGRDVQDWKVADAQKDLRDSGPVKGNIVPILYRPFDIRWTYFTGRSRGFICRPRGEVMGHMLAGGNRVLSATRSIEIDAGFHHCFAADVLTTHHTVSVKEVNYAFPLYLYPAGDLAMETERKANLADGFLRALRGSIGNEAPAFTPEDVFHYIYAVFHSPTYRSRYEEFLAIDFPRVPLPGSDALFRELSRIGEELVALHLVRKAGADMPKYPIPGSDLVERVRYEAPTPLVGRAGEGAESATAPVSAGRVWINKAQYFSPVPREVWDFHIGGYRVCEKWLKDRKDRTLGADDLEHYAKIVANVAETIRLMERLDEVIDAHGGWPAAFGRH
ncbi:MAG: type ISP restriction/modification enzyme [Armatimonadota bacterium]